MLDYKVFLSLEATLVLRTLPKATQYSILSYLNYLESNPFDEGDFVSIQDPEKEIFASRASENI